MLKEDKPIGRLFSEMTIEVALHLGRETAKGWKKLSTELEKGWSKVKEWNTSLETGLSKGWSKVKNFFNL